MRDEDRSWKYTSVLLSRGERQFICSIRDGSGNEILVYEHKHFERSTINTLMRSGDPDIEFAERERQLYRTYFNDIFSDTNAQSSIRTRVIEALGEKDGLFSIDYTPISGRNRGKLTTVYYIGRQKRQVIWLADIAYRKGDRVILKDKISTLWDDLNWNNVAREGGISFPNGKKPIAFIQRMLELTTTGEDEELILDFFGGSGSTGHAVFNVNAKDNGNRRFIIVQLPVQAKEAHQFHQFGNIAELSKQRLRNAINESEKIIRGQRGFKVYRYQHSHFKKWQIIDNCSSQQLDYLLSQYESSVEAEWQVSGLCTEILLIEGFPLDSQQTQLEAVTTNTIWRVHHPDVGHELYICLDATLAPETLDMLKTGTLVQGDNIFICLDSALSDEAKVVLDDRLRLKVI
jgi:adenine-specific DNA-methyltransferase